MVVKPGREHEVEAIFEKWDLHAVKVGVVTDGSQLRVRERGALVVDIPNRALTDEAPVYHRPTRRPDWLDQVQQLDLSSLTPTSSAADTLRTLLASPTIASKRWIYRQYDHMVRTNTIVLPGLGCGVVRVKGTNRALAMSVDGQGRFGLLDPRQGARLAVAESARNVACAGALPIAATNNLNFGNPQKPEIMWQFAEAVAGIGEACRALDTPITGGNVSLYNETEGRAIFPTPVLGVVGLLDDASKTATRVFKTIGSAVVLLGDNLGELGGSEYLATMHNLVAGKPPVIDLKREAALQALIVKLIRDGCVESAHDCSEGGLAITLAECTFDSGGIGVSADVTAVGDPLPDPSAVEGFSVNATLFGESASRIVVSCASRHLDAVMTAAKAAEVSAREIGRVGGDSIRLSVNGQVAIDSKVAVAEQAWATAIENKMRRKPRADS